MKHYIILMAVTLTMICSKSSAQQIDKINPQKEWLSGYRDYVTYSCICEITNDALLQIMIKKKDLSFGVHSEILGNQLGSADSLGRKLAQSTLITVRPGGTTLTSKESLLNCIRLRNSKVVDSIARQQYKLYLKDQVQ